MKIRDSGMPEEALWREFFDPLTILKRLGLSGEFHDALEFGCGYGTFSVAAASLIRGTLYALDIEQSMINSTIRKASEAGLSNVRTQLRDFVSDGTGLEPESVDYVMLFNILHAENPLTLLAEARRVIRKGGVVSIIHWNYDLHTPRGPSLEIRPRPEQCQAWAISSGFEVRAPGIIDLPPYHYGLSLGV